MIYLKLISRLRTGRVINDRRRGQRFIFRRVSLAAPSASARKFRGRARTLAAAILEVVATVFVRIERSR